VRSELRRARMVRDIKIRIWERKKARNDPTYKIENERTDLAAARLVIADLEQVERNLQNALEREERMMY